MKSSGPPAEFFLQTWEGDFTSGEWTLHPSSLVGQGRPGPDVPRGARPRLQASVRGVGPPSLLCGALRAGCCGRMPRPNGPSRGCGAQPEEV